MIFFYLSDNITARTRKETECLSAIAPKKSKCFPAGDLTAGKR